MCDDDDGDAPAAVYTPRGMSICVSLSLSPYGCIVSRGGEDDNAKECE